MPVPRPRRKKSSTYNCGAGNSAPSARRRSPKAPRRDGGPDHLVTPEVECSPRQGHVRARRQKTRSMTYAHHRVAAHRRSKCPQGPRHNNGEGAQRSGRPVDATWGTLKALRASHRSMPADPCHDAVLSATGRKICHFVQARGVGTRDSSAWPNMHDGVGQSLSPVWPGHRVCCRISPLPSRRSVSARGALRATYAPGSLASTGSVPDGLRPTVPLLLRG